jgi:hypothetical protein
MKLTTLSDIRKMMQAEDNCKWRKRGKCTHPEASKLGQVCPWADRVQVLWDWYPRMYAEAKQ